MKLKFYGGAKMVTGSNFLLSSGDEKILIDCGLYQGSYYCERHNFDPFKYDPKEIKAVLITHAHIDHVGLLPKLYKDGFRGVVYSTPPTKDFAKELLLDSEDILRREAKREKAKPIYSANDIDSLMKIWETVKYDEFIKIGKFKAMFKNAGHILGSSSIIIEAEGKTIIFSGDLGNDNPPLIEEWKPLEVMPDYCLVESTYGNRFHEGSEKRAEMLEDVIEETIKNNGVLIIPSFAMERIQGLLFQLNELVENGRIPRVPIYVDSPLAIRLTAVYKWYESYFNKEAGKILAKDKSLFSFPGLKLSYTTEESKDIDKAPAPKIIVAGSGMSQGGRIIFHEKNYLSDPNNTILFIGYQIVGSLGRRILDGAKIVKILGEEVAVKARVVNISSYSAHADQERLIKWLRPMRYALKKIFVVQGDPEAAEEFAVAIRDQLAVSTYVPSEGEEVMLE